MRFRGFAKILIFALIPLLKAHVANAIAGPPLVTDDPATPGANMWEINIAASLVKNSEESRLELPYLDLNYGWGEHIQLKYEVPYVFSNNPDEGSQHTGFDRSEVGVKWRFQDKYKAPPDEKAEGVEKVEGGGNKSAIALSIYPQFTFKSPVAESARNVDAPTNQEWFLPVEAEETKGRWDFNQEIGYRWLQGEPSHIAGGVATTFTINEETAMLLGEIHFESKLDASEIEMFANVGTVLAINKWSNFLFSIGRTFVEFENEPNKTLAYAAIQLNL